MAQSASDTQNDNLPSADLGANEWLVEEMRDQYDADPSSVGPEWKTYFEGNGAPGNGAGPTPGRAEARRAQAGRAQAARAQAARAQQEA